MFVFVPGFIRTPVGLGYFLFAVVADYHGLVPALAEAKGKCYLTSECDRQISFL